MRQKEVIFRGILAHLEMIVRLFSEVYSLIRASAPTRLIDLREEKTTKPREKRKWTLRGMSETAPDSTKYHKKLSFFGRVSLIGLNYTPEACAKWRWLQDIRIENINNHIWIYFSINVVTHLIFDVKLHACWADHLIFH